MVLINLFIENKFLLRALIACIDISFICPVLGVLLLLKRMSLVGDAISHAILPGVAIGFMLGGMSIIYMAIGGLIAGVIVTILAIVVSYYTKIKEDASFAGFYLLSLAIGVIIISKNGTNVDLIHILFGSILAVGSSGLWLLSIITTFSLVMIMFIIRPLIIDIFDKNLLRIYHSYSLVSQLIFIFLVVINLVIDFQILGTILVVGLMMLPASIGKLLAKSLNMMLLTAIVSSVLSSIVGIILSFYLDLPTGPSIILINGIIYIISIIYTQLLKYIKRPHFIN
jgi:zinc/manganese transport system permease protein